MALIGFRRKVGKMYNWKLDGEALEIKWFKMADIDKKTN